MAEIGAKVLVVEDIGEAAELERRVGLSNFKQEEGIGRPRMNG